MRTNKFMFFFLALVLVVAVAAVGCGEDVPAPAEPVNGESGTFQGEGQGYNEDEPIRVEVTLEDGMITDITILEHAETDGLADPALEQTPQDIIDAQSSNVDAVTDATATSEGIMEAVNDAVGM